MDLKQERLCKKTTLWAKGKKNRQLFQSVSFWAKKRNFFFSRKYRSLQDNKHFVKKERRAKPWETEGWTKSALGKSKDKTLKAFQLLEKLAKCNPSFLLATHSKNFLFFWLLWLAFARICFSKSFSSQLFFRYSFDVISFISFQQRCTWFCHCFFRPIPTNNNWKDNFFFHNCFVLDFSLQFPSSPLVLPFLFFPNFTKHNWFCPFFFPHSTNHNW